MTEAAAKLTFDTLDAERQLSEIERRLDGFARRAENLSTGLGAAGGVGGPSGMGGNPSGAAPAVVGSSDPFASTNEKLSQIVDLLKGGAGGGGSGSGVAGGGGGSSRWEQPDSPRPKADSNTSRGGRSGFGALTGAVTTMAGASNPVSGIASGGAAIIGAVGGPIAGAVAGMVAGLVGVLVAAAQQAVQVATTSSKMLRAEHIRTGTASDARTVATRLSAISANGGWSPEEAQQMAQEEQSASGLGSSVGGAAGTLKMAGVSMSGFGRFRGASRQYGGTTGGSYEALRLAGMARGVGLDPNTILDQVASSRSTLAPYGGGDDGTGEQRDFMERVYSTEAGRSTGKGAAGVITGLAQGNVSRAERFREPLKTMASTFDDMAAYETAGKSGATDIFGYSAALSDAAINQTPEQKAMSYKARGLSSEQAGSLLAASTGQSFAAGSAVANAAGDYGIPTMDFSAPGADAASMQTDYLRVLGASAEQDSINIAGSLDHLGGILGTLKMMAAWDRGKRDFSAGVADAVFANP